MFQFRLFAAICSLLIATAVLCAQTNAGYQLANVAPGSGTRLTTPRPAPTPKPTPKPPPIPVPSHVRPVQSKQDCAAALTLLAGLCDAAVKTGTLQLVWRDSATKLDGYKIYRVKGEHRTLVLTLSNGVQPKYGAISKPNGGYDHNCYAVSAYLGQRESTLSSAYCVEPGATATTATFSPAHARSYVTITYPSLYDPNNNSGYLSWSKILPMTGSMYTALVPSQVLNSGQAASVNGTVYVGYEYVHVSEPNPTNGQFYSGTNNGFVKVRSRGGYDFNLGKLNNRKIYSATLTLDVSQTLQNTSTKNGFKKDDYSCADRYFVGRDFWWSQNGALNNVSTGADFSLANGPTLSVDVTKTVAAWAAGQADYGFILSNALADLNAKPAYVDLACFTKYYTAHLKVIYF